MLAAKGGNETETTTMTATLSIKLPPVFIRDCIECDCDVGDYANGVLTATPEQFGELKSRAEFYIHPDGPDAVGGWIRTAARAVLKALAKAQGSAA